MASEKDTVHYLDDAEQGERTPTCSLTAQQQWDPAFEVSWRGVDDTSNPRNWAQWYKAYVLLTVSWTTLVCVVEGAAYTSGVAQMQQDYPQFSKVVLNLGLTTYLVGWIFGSLAWAPLSEMYGRRPIYLLSTTCFAALMVPCALAPTAVGVIIARFFAGVASSGSIALSPGTISDVANEQERALAYSVWSLAPFMVIAIAPIVGGFTTQYLGWRYINWFILGGTGLALVLLVGARETYAPVLLRRKAKSLRTESGQQTWWSRFDTDDNLKQKLKTNLTRPFVLGLTEPMLVLWNLYIGLDYGVLYLSFTAYPIVFGEIRGWSTSHTGLSFLGLGAGVLTAVVSEPLIRRVINSQRKDPDTQKPIPEATISVVCLGAVLMPVGEFWFAWTAGSKSIHWIWPILAGFPYGLGATLGFIYALNYLACSYGIYAASALTGNTVWRCLFGAFLPLAGPTMISSLGVDWASSVLGFALVALAPLPFVFYRFGARIRRKSKVIAEAKAEEARLAGKTRS